VLWTLTRLGLFRVDLGYDKILVEKAFHMVAFLDRKKLLIYKKKRIDFENCNFF
jgi:hypothetical protein